MWPKVSIVTDADLSRRNLNRSGRRATVAYENSYSIDPNVRSRLLNFLTIFAGLLLLARCDSAGQQDKFAEDASAPPRGFVQTQDGTEIISDDLDDWRTAPMYAGKLSVRPAYPNPAAVEDFVTVPFNVTAFGAVRAPLRLEVLRDGRLVRLESLDRAGDPGGYTFTFSAARLGRTGLHRLYIFDGAGELASYGDVMIQ